MVLAMLDLWYKNAIIYCIDVDNYMDANGDGVGDFEGLNQRLDYIDGLGVTCIWLMPFYPSPNRDNGYDVMDYYSVDPRLGTLGDFVEFMRHANERGIRVIVDLVVNHTSDQHSWFQAARQDKHSKYRDFYVWSPEKPPDAEEGIIFPGEQESTWTYDEQAGAYYFHRFYDHQPDLNITNPAVREEIYKVMGFWLELGVSGFRIDAAPFLIELKGINNADVSDPYLYLKEIRNLLSWRRGDAILLAEANVSVEHIPEYFGDGDKMHLLFNFILNQQLILALAQEQAAPLIKGLQAPPQIPAVGQWANFVRNHDELSLDKLSDTERDEIAAKFAPDKENLWVFNRGIRRRLPPMLEGDERRIKLAYSLMFSLPGTPVLNYGEEIGMGDDLSLKGRDSARTPMQWSDQTNAGFSVAPSDRLIRPVIDQGEYSYERVNVVAQRRHPNSMLNSIERMIRTRKDCPEFGWGNWQILEVDHPSVFAHRCEWRNSVVVAVHNLAKSACTVTLNLNTDEATHLVDLLEDQDYEPIDPNSQSIQLAGYGYRWLRLGNKPV